MVKLTIKCIKKGITVFPEVTLTEAKVDISDVVTGTKELPDSILKVVIISAMVELESVAAELVVSGVAVFRIVVGFDPSP